MCACVLCSFNHPAAQMQALDILDEKQAEEPQRASRQRSEQDQKEDQKKDQKKDQNDLFDAFGTGAFGRSALDDADRAVRDARDRAERAGRDARELGERMRRDTGRFW